MTQHNVDCRGATIRSPHNTLCIDVQGLKYNTNCYTGFTIQYLLQCRGHNTLHIAIQGSQYNRIAIHIS